MKEFPFFSLAFLFFFLFSFFFGKKRNFVVTIEGGIKATFFMIGNFPEVMIASLKVELNSFSRGAGNQ